MPDYPERQLPPTPSASAPGAIERNVVYRIDEVKRRMGWRDSAFRAACRNGLRVHRVGKRGYVAGLDLVAYITKGGAR